MIRVMLRFLGCAVATSLALVAVVLGYLYLRHADAARPPSGKVDMSPASIARGRYIYELADCDGCHSERDFSRFSGPVVPSGRGKGVMFPPEFGLPGAIVARNITSDRETGIGAWSDGEKIRAIRDGIGRDGAPLFPLMPYQSFRHMSDRDVCSLVAYLNTLPPVRNPLPRSKVRFPESLLIKSVPHPAGTVSAPDTADRVGYGRYLATIAGCECCHTPSKNRRPVAGMAFAGGEQFRFGFATVVSPNITPDKKTGIGTWSEGDFLNRFHRYREYAEQGPPRVGPEDFTLMPWLQLAKLPAGDLRAIYAYLRTVPAVSHHVESHPDAAPNRLGDNRGAADLRTKRGR